MSRAPHTEADSPAIRAEIFRAYDIRGIAGSELDPVNIRCIGRAIGEMALQRGHDTLLFGADGRLSSPELGAALREGILDSGCHVNDLGLVPTPLLYFATWHCDCESGVMLTASHNPAHYNGIKIVMDRCCLQTEAIQALYQRSLELATTAGEALPAGKRGRMSMRNIEPAYLARIRADVKLQRPLHVVVDCGNAVPGLIAPALFSALGCRVVPLFCEVDGHFPHHHPDPTIAANLESLVARVREEQADLGVALDGDGDRVVIVSNSGAIVDTDRLLMLFVRDILPRYEGSSVIFDVKCSHLLASVIEQAGGRPLISRSGHSFMKHRMQETEAAVGGEFSAHVFIRDRWYGFDDGLYVAARFMEILAAGSHSVDDLLATLPSCVSTPELRIEVGDARKFQLMERIGQQARFPAARITRVDGIRADFAHGWGLVRASNTTPALLLRFEADNGERLREIQQAFRELLRRTDPGLDIPF